MTDMKPSTSVTADDVHRFMWSKRNSRDLVSSDQKELAEEFGVHHIKFHRLVKQLLETGKLKVTAVGSRGMKTFKVLDPAPKDEESTPNPLDPSRPGFIPLFLRRSHLPE